MAGTGEILIKVTHIKQLYEDYIYEDKDEIGLKPLEISLLLFLWNHKEQNTARDFCRLCMVPKSNASNGIRMLERKGMLRITTDKEDKKIRRLFITEKAERIARKIAEHQNEFLIEVFNIFTDEEKTLMTDMMNRLDMRVLDLLQQRACVDEIEMED